MTTIAVAWIVSTATIISPYFDNAESIERDDGFGAPKIGYRSTMSSFQMSPGSACSILTVIYLSGGSDETARCLLALKYKHRGPPALGVMVSAATELHDTYIMTLGTFLTSYVHWFLYLLSLPDTIFQEDNVMLHTTCCTSCSYLPRYTEYSIVSLACMVL
ncbi:hypothetical protein HNY73_007265 [Argiope bruennichi]|uniref:Uncharacterized protein n=1 Tax=Argiope bruennichi TaxID=94029 RepID=A0A8T0FDF6_ARGBR|nr:hypothetical protein HNY73_007265 [Argiope bruennichi]